MKSDEAMGRFARFAALIAAEERKSRQAAQLENERLKERLARSGVEQRRAVREAVLKEREACALVCDENAHRLGSGPGYAALMVTAESIRAMAAQPIAELRARVLQLEIVPKRLPGERGQLSNQEHREAPSVSA